MTPAKMRKVAAVVLDTELDSTLRLFARLGVVHVVDVKTRAKELNTELSPVEPSNRFYHVSNLLTRVTSLITTMKVVRGGKPKNKERLEVPDSPDDSYFTSLEGKVKVVEDQFTELSQKLKTAQESADKATRKTERKAAKKAIKTLAAESRSQLLAWEELLQGEQALEKTKTLLGKTQRTYVVTGWIPAKRAKRFSEAVSQESHNTVAVDITDYQEPKHHEEEGSSGSEAESHEQPPTKLTNPRFLGAYESLTTAFGFPNHREIDPTFFMAIAFPIIFGLMFGDIGHGVILLAFALLGMAARKKGLDIGELGNYFLKGSGLIAVCAIFSIFFGVLYGEFLGLSITGLPVYDSLRESLFGVVMRGALLGLFRVFDFDAGVTYFTTGAGSHLNHGAIWFSAFETPEETWLLFVLSIMIGVIHLSIAITLDLVNKLRRHEFKHALFGPAVWLWFFFGLIILLFTKGMNFMNWFSYVDLSGEQANLLGSGLVDALVFLIAPLLVMMIGGMLAAGIMEGFMEALEHLIASISNTISYARILALNMAHAGFAKTFLFIGGLAETALIYIPETGAITINISPSGLPMLIIMLLVGTIFILLMEGLLSFIHTLRLHWVEAYLKFYAGNGYAYAPLALAHVWTTSTPRAAAK
jgi:V/A-type H+-transporting ATPase subunit I